MITMLTNKLEVRVLGYEPRTGDVTVQGVVNGRVRVVSLGALWASGGLGELRMVLRAAQRAQAELERGEK